MPCAGPGEDHVFRAAGDETHCAPCRAEEARALWLAVAAPGWDGPAMWLHGDLHPANVLVSDGTLSGVIDFGDLCAGDPATIRRARGWAVLRGVSLVGIGLAWERGLPGGRPTGGRAGRRTLDRVLASG